jgi:hypothetical protein
MSGYSLFRVSARGPAGSLKSAEIEGGPDPENLRFLTVYVHGFNNTKAEATDNWDGKIWPGIKKLMMRQEHDVMLFLWPSDPNTFKSLAPVGYPNRVKTAIGAGVELGKYLTKISECNEDLQVQFIGYSLGCRVVLSAVEHLSEQSQTVPVVRVLLMGAAVPEGDCTEPGPWPSKVGALFGAAQGQAAHDQNLGENSDVVLHSSNDDVLGRKFELGERWARRRGLESRGGKAVGLTGGPSPCRWTGVADPCELKHDGYLTDDAALRHVAAMVGTLRDRRFSDRRGGERSLDEQHPDQRQLLSVARRG